MHIRSRAPDNVAFTKVKGHATKDDVRCGRVQAIDKLGNDAADELAVSGASEHAVPEGILGGASRRKNLARRIHLMMVDIAIERAKRDEEGEESDTDDVLAITGFQAPD